MEYILGGKNSDIENLKYVVHRLLLIREVSNVTYLFSDGAKMAEAAAMAFAVATAAGVPVLIEPIKISLLLRGLMQRRCMMSEHFWQAVVCLC